MIITVALTVQTSLVVGGVVWAQWLIQITMESKQSNLARTYWMRSRFLSSMISEKMIAKLLIINCSLASHWDVCRCKAIIAKLHPLLKSLMRSLNTGLDLNLSFVRQDQLGSTTYSFSIRNQTLTSSSDNTKSKTWQRMKKQKNLFTFLVDLPQTRKSSRMFKNDSLP